MTFSEETKAELVKINFDQTCCKIAALSAFIRGAGSIITAENKIGFDVIVESRESIERISSLIAEVYGEKTEIVEDENRFRLRCLTDNSINILSGLGIIEVKSDGIDVNFAIDKYIIENECCKKAYITGYFVGGGSVTIPKLEGKSTTSYHLEFVFSQYQTASDFNHLLCEEGFFPRLIVRKEHYVVYLNRSDEISDMIGYMGAVKSCLKLQDHVVKKSMFNDTNRKINCDLGNLNKQINASLKQRQNIQLIIDTVGLESLQKPLYDVAKARLENPESNLEDIAEMLGLTKSCVNHRLRKINEIAGELK